MKIATWNVNSLRVRLPHVLNWINDKKPDVLALQETKLVDEQFPSAEFEAVGYQAVFSGQKTYNGVAILSTKEIGSVDKDIPALDDPQRRILAVTIDDIRVINLYVVNGSEVGSEKFEYKLEWLEKVTDYIRDQLSCFSKVIILGDFNIAPEDRDVHDPDLWRDRILCSREEREALNKMITLGFVDIFRLFSDEDQVFSWWDYRAAAFRRNRGLRIDLILSNKVLSSKCKGCEIDKDPRTWERPSDHAPVIATFKTVMT